MSNENLKKAIDDLRKSAQNVIEEAKDENLSPDDLINEEGLSKISGGNTEPVKDCNGFCDSFL